MPGRRVPTAPDRAAQRDRWRAEGWYPILTVGQAIEQGARRAPDSRLLFASGGAIDVTSLGALHERASRMATVLLERGLAPGDVVAVQAPASAGSVALVEALWLIDAVLVPVVAAHGAQELADAARRSGAGAALAPDDIADLDEQATSAEALPAALAGDPSEVSCVIYTSGSTAEPKGVQHSHETLLAGLVPPPDAPPDPGVTLMTFPAGHIASVLGLVRPLLTGSTTVVMDRWSAATAAALVEEHRVTSSAGTPFFLSSLLDDAERTGRDISSLRLFLVGAAAVPPALVERAEAAGIVAFRSYGSTEHPGITAASPDDPPERRFRTDGRANPGNEVRIVDDDGGDVPGGEEGEVVARGPKQFLGYRGAEADDDAFLPGSWFRTGDIGRLDADGSLTITDRKKDIIIRGGENISAREVEEALASHPAVADVAVCGVPDEVWGERVCAVVVARDGDPPSLSSLQEHVSSAGLPRTRLPAQLEVVDDLPRTAAGKVRKPELRERLRLRGAATPGR